MTLIKEKRMANKSKYHDPLHVPSEQLVIYYNGKPHSMLSKAFLDQTNAWGNLEALKEVYWLKCMFNEMIEKSNDPCEIRDLAKNLTECEFEIQELWGFPRDIKYHRFWQAKKCTCAQMDNEEAWPSGYYSIDLNCLLHGDSAAHTKLGKEIL